MRFKNDRNEKDKDIDVMVVVLLSEAKHIEFLIFN